MSLEREQDIKRPISETPSIFISERREHHIFQTHASYKAMNNLMKSKREALSNGSKRNRGDRNSGSSRRVEKENVAKWPKAVLKEEIDFDPRLQGPFSCIISGSSGCGKSTLTIWSHRRWKRSFTITASGNPSLKKGKKTT